MLAETVSARRIGWPNVRRNPSPISLHMLWQSSDGIYERSCAAISPMQRAENRKEGESVEENGDGGRHGLHEQTSQGRAANLRQRATCCEFAVALYETFTGHDGRQKRTVGHFKGAVERTEQDGNDIELFDRIL